MRKLLFVIILFFSTSVFAGVWEELPPSFDMSYHINTGFKIIHVQEGGSKLNSFFTYSLTHPDFGLRICSVFISANSPYITICYKEKEN